MSQIFIYNSLTKQCEDIGHKKHLNFYVCGPTTYSHSHLGHARNYIVHDTIRRILEMYFNIHVTYVMNITDIDDKIINASVEKFGDDTLEHCKQISDFFEHEFFSLMDKLCVMRPTFLTRVTEFIPEMNNYVQNIMTNGYAYEKDGSIWFNSQKFISDGHNINPFGVQSDGADFCLLKHKTNNEAHFVSSLGNFRPGWHLECSAMSSSVLGHVDIHGGGIDLMFPHHTNEILQACAHDKCDEWCKIFYHCGHLGISGQKMSKSEKNFTTISEALEHYPPQQLRLYFLKCDHNKMMDFSYSELDGCSSMYNKLKTFASLPKILKLINQTKPNENDFIVVNNYKKTKVIIDACLRNNFDTLGVVNNMCDLVNIVNNNLLSMNVNIVIEIHSYVIKILNVIGVSFLSDCDSERTDMMMHYLVELRNDVRYVAQNKTVDKETKTKLFKVTDKFRDVVFPSLGMNLVDK